MLYVCIFLDFQQISLRPIPAPPPVEVVEVVEVIEVCSVVMVV